MFSAEKPLYLITDGGRLRSAATLIDRVAGALYSRRIAYVQLREQSIKNSIATDREVVELGRRIHPLCKEFGAQLLINRRVDLAKEIGADGVHLGRRSISIQDARSFLSKGSIVAYSAHGGNDIPVDADFVTLSPVYAPISKESKLPPIGIGSLHEIAENSEIPVVALGGITCENAEMCKGKGVVGVAAIASLLYNEASSDAAHRLADAFCGSH